MAVKRAWGLLCPDGHGLLVTEGWKTQGVAWCGHIDHGGNGRFYRTAEVQEGYHDPSQPPVVTDAMKERQARAAEKAAEWTAYHTEQAEKERKRKMTADTETKPKSPSKTKTPQECLCGCKGLTKGGRFLPGHDARYHAAQKRAEAAAAGTPEPIKPTKPRKAKPVDLTAKAEDSPSEDIALD